MWSPKQEKVLITFISMLDLVIDYTRLTYYSSYFAVAGIL